MGSVAFNLRIMGLEQNPDIALIITSIESLDLTILEPLTSRSGSMAEVSHPLVFKTSQLAKRLSEKVATGNHETKYDSATRTWRVAERGWFGPAFIDWSKAKVVQVSEDLRGEIKGSEIKITMDPKEYSSHKLYTDFRVLSKDKNIYVRVPAMVANGRRLEARSFKFYLSEKLRFGFGLCLGSN